MAHTHVYILLRKLAVDYRIRGRSWKNGNDIINLILKIKNILKISNTV